MYKNVEKALAKLRRCAFTQDDLNKLTKAEADELYEQLNTGCTRDDVFAFPMTPDSYKLIDSRDGVLQDNYLYVDSEGHYIAWYEFVINEWTSVVRREFGGEEVAIRWEKFAKQCDEPEARCA